MPVTFECLDRMVPLGERHFRRRSRNSSITTIASGITKDPRIGLSTGAGGGDVRRDSSASAARCLIELLRASGVKCANRPAGRRLEHYADAPEFHLGAGAIYNPRFQ
jgi:hypothetical protein